MLGDCDVQLSEPDVRRRYRLDHLRLGDLVALRPVDFRFGPSRQADRVTFGVVVHSDSHVAGRGPGVTPLPAPSEAERRAAWGRRAPLETAPTPTAPCTCGTCG